MLSTSIGVFGASPMAVSFRWKISKTSLSPYFRVDVFMVGEKDPPSPTRNSPSGVIRSRTAFASLPREVTAKFSTTPIDQASPCWGVEPLGLR